MKKTLISILSFVITVSIAQVDKERVMHRNISSGLADEIAPSLTLDGNTMAFLKKDMRSSHYTIHISTKNSEGKWPRPTEVSSTIAHASMQLTGSYCLSPDGNTIVFTTTKHPTVGSYDLWISTKSNGSWSKPNNIAAPINTSVSEGMPSFSADSKTLYFIRGTVTKSRILGDVYMTKKTSKGNWANPKKVNLPIKVSQIQPHVNKTHYLINDGKGIRFYEIKTKKLGVYLITDPTAFATIDYKNNKITYSKHGKESFDIFQGILSTQTDVMPNTTIQYITKAPQKSMITIYDENNKFVQKRMTKNTSIQTTYIAPNSHIAIQNRDLDYIYSVIPDFKTPKTYREKHTFATSYKFVDSTAKLISDVELGLLKSYLEQGEKEIIIYYNNIMPDIQLDSTTVLTIDMTVVIQSDVEKNLAKTKLASLVKDKEYIWVDTKSLKKDEWIIEFKKK